MTDDTPEYMDSETHLLNRRGFELLARKKLVGSEQSLQSPCMLLVDIDHFNLLDNHFGHSLGDAYLGHFGRMVGVVGIGCVPSRTNVHEFALICNDRHYTQMIADELIAANEKLINRFCPEVPPELKKRNALKLTIGIAKATPGGTYEQLLRNVRDAVYRKGKQAGGNCIVWYDQ